MNKTATLPVNNLRSDTIDVLHYSINLDFTDFSNQILKGYAEIVFSSKMNNIANLSLDLLQLNIDSIVYSDGTTLTYNYNDTLLNVNFPSPLTQGALDSLKVYYNGVPQGDPSGWGGFYYGGGYAYNLGVGFDANPHNYGRVWFPCFDNFVERSTYTFTITSSAGRKGHCNGYLVSENVLSGDTIQRTWQMDEEIPSYLACVAVGNYVTIKWDHSGISGIIPVELAALASDTTNVKGSFAYLDTAIAIFENGYGPYLWNKVGYTMVPFSSGAMEHATNIAFPRIAANGTLTYETLIAHELSHHWWGDLVTCETAEDMWINEGWATYSEHLYLEKRYDWDTYINAVKDNHQSVIQFSHINEGSYLALSEIPHEYTYGEHVYNKGAAVAHNMRGYLGDSLFFSGLKALMDTNKYSHMNSTKFRDDMTNITGYDLTDFFDGWVFNGGFPEFSIDSFTTTPVGGNYDVQIYASQKLRGATSYFNNVPLQLTCMDNDHNVYRQSVIFSGQNTTFNITSTVNPTMVFLNENNAINYAVTADQQMFQSTGGVNFLHGKALLTVDQIADSAFIRVEHHWATPDPIKNSTGRYRLSNTHFWEVIGDFPAGLSASCTFNYNGKSTSGYLDADLLPDANEDSITLMYRINSSADWVVYPYFTKNMLGTGSDRNGSFEIDSLLPGEYTFASEDISVASIHSIIKKDFNIFPNPTLGMTSIVDLNSNDNLAFEVSIYNMLGERLISKIGKSKIEVNIQEWSPGIYSVVINKEGGQGMFSKLIKID